MKSQYVIDLFLKNKRRHVQSIKRYKSVFKSFTAKFPEMPTTGLEINDWLSGITGTESNLYTYYAVMRAVYKFTAEQLDLPDAFKKLHPPKVGKTQRRTWTPDELSAVLNNCSGKDRILIMTLIDSTCRIGELGAHELEKGNFYPGLNVSNLNHNSFTCTAKRGIRKYRLQPALLDAMRNIADTNGFIFTTRKGKPMSSHYMAKYVTTICKWAGLKGIKLGAHTFRHTSGSMVDKHTLSALAVKALLQRDKIETSMLYIHDAEDDIQQEISPLELVAESLNYTPQRVTQLALPPGESSIDFMPVETIEIQRDLTDQLFKKIPDDFTRLVTTKFNRDELVLLRQVFSDYCLRNSGNGNTPKIVGIFNRMFKYIR